MEKKMNWRNTGIKFGLDQTLGALVNTVVFLAVMAAAEGKGWSGVVGRVGEVCLTFFLLLVLGCAIGLVGWLVC